MRDRTVAALHSLPRVELARDPTPVEPLSRLGSALGAASTSLRAGPSTSLRAGPSTSLRAGGPRLFVKRDDAIPFAFGGNKVRKVELVAAEALARRADTLVTAGGIQSNHARVTAAAAARLGLRCLLVASGAPPVRPTANALLDALLGAEVHYVESREARAPAMEALAERLAREGRRPFVIPVGASTATGALAYVRAVGELVGQGLTPDVIVHATSSGGTQAGLVAGCRLFGLRTHVLGISADDPAATIAADVGRLIQGVEERLGLHPGDLGSEPAVEVDDRFVGGGYGVATPESREAIELFARTEALFLDPTYTAKAAAALLAGLRQGRWAGVGSILFWHTGGQVGLFAS